MVTDIFINECCMIKWKVLVEHSPGGIGVGIELALNFCMSL